MTEIPLSAIDRLIRVAGSDKVSVEAAKYLRILAEEYCIGIAKEANRLAHHAGRVTVSKEDIEVAFHGLHGTKRSTSLG